MTWLEFKAACETLLTVDGSASRQTIGGYNAILLRNGVYDLQRFIPQLRTNQRNRYRVSDLAQEGEASLGTLPDKASVREAFLVRKTCPCNMFPLLPYQWEYRFDLICDKPRRHEWPYYISIDPSASEFMVYPKIKEDDELWIYWDGMKTDFSDTDTVRFGEEEALAVSYYIKGHITREVDKDLQLKRDYMDSYIGAPGRMGLRTKLFLDWKERGEIRHSIRPPDPSCAPCTPCTSMDCCWDYSCITGGFSKGFWYLQHPTTGNWHKITTIELDGQLTIRIYDGIADDCIEFDECLTASARGYMFSGGYFHLLNETSGGFTALSIVGIPGEEMLKMEPQKGTIGFISTTAFGFRLATCLELRNLDESCNRHTWHQIGLIDLGVPQLSIGAGDCVVCPTIPATPEPEPEGFTSAEQSVQCESGEDLQVTGALEPYLTASGPSLILQAGYSSSLVSQAEADATALAALQTIFDDGIASGLFNCGLVPSAAQSISCGGDGDLNNLLPLPDNLSISGPTLTVEEGAFSATTQVAADALALAYVTDYFNEGILAGTLVCGVFLSAEQTVSCPVVGNELSATDALPPNFSIVGNSLILAAGYTTSDVSQANANAAALAALQAFFDSGISSGLLVCETPIPDPPFMEDLCGAWWKADSFAVSTPNNTPIGDVGLELINSLNPGTYDMVQTTPGFRPLYQKNVFGTRPGIFFDGIDDFLLFNPLIVFESIVGTLSQACTICFVFKQTGTNNNGMLLCRGGGATHQIWSRGANPEMFAFDSVGGVFSSAATTVPATSPRVITFRNEVFVSNQMFRENGVNKGPFTQSNLGFEFDRFGETLGHGSGITRFSGWLAEILMYCRTLNDAECLQVEQAYCGVKYPVIGI